MAGFRFRRDLGGSYDVPALMYGIGKDSIAFQVGDLVRVNTSGFVDVVDATEGIAGIIVQVVDSNGIKKEYDSGTLDTYTLSSDNTTVAKDKIGFTPALPNYLFYNDADATLTQAMEYQYFDTNDENDVDVGTATDTYSAQVQLISRDPDEDADLSKGLFRVVESQFAQAGGDRAA